MTDKLYIYCILWAIAIICVLAFALKLEKLIQIIVWNYFLGMLFFSLWFCMDFAIKSNPDTPVSNFFVDAKVWLLLLLYWLFFFFFVYRRSKIRVDFSSDPMIYKPLYLAFVPFHCSSTAMLWSRLHTTSYRFSALLWLSLSEPWA